MQNAMRIAMMSGKRGPKPPAYGGLCFTAEADNSSVQLTAAGSAPAVTLVKSFDGVNWEAYAVGEVIDLPSVGDFVYLAAGEGGNETFCSSSSPSSEYNKFVINGLIAASGDITSLRRFELIQTPLENYCYCSLFSGCTGLTSAPDLPATTLATSCYKGMFSGCTGLTRAPDLPATTLSSHCYQDMFNGCTGLTRAPDLPATTIAAYCYQGMFSGCTGLTSAPELPATTIASYCYQDMFYGCTGLTSAPDLPATDLLTYSYRRMFYGCTGLTRAPDLQMTTISGYNCCRDMFNGCTNLCLIKVRFTAWGGTRTASWVSGVSPTGTFYKPSSLPEEYGINRIPTGWTVVNID